MSTPNKLEWKPDEEFIISGIEMEIIIQELIRKLSTTEAEGMIKAYECLKSLQDKIRTIS